MKSSTAAALLAATSFLVAPGLHLVVQPVAADVPAVVERRATNWILAVDCSGSMSEQLPRIGGHLKAKLAKILNDNDTATLIWFSGRGETAAIFKAELVAGPADLQGLGKMIDRWLRPVGLTAFVDPLRLVKTIVKELGAKNPAAANALIFLTDGADNQYGRTEILKAVRDLAEDGIAMTLVEYGYYCNRPLMTAMAEAGGAALVFADGFMSYEPLIEAALRKAVTGSKKRAITVPKNATGGFAYGFSGADLVTFSIDQTNGPVLGDIAVPEDMREVFYLSAEQAAVRSTETLANLAKAFSRGEDARVSALEERAMAGAFAAIAMFAQRMNPDVVLPLLRALGDVALIKLYQGAFTIQSYQTLVDAATTAARDVAGRWTAGYDPKAVPEDDCPTIFDLLDILIAGKASIQIDKFIANYDRIGRATVDANTVLTTEEIVELSRSAPGLAPLPLFDGLESVAIYQEAVEAHATRTKEHLTAIETLLESKKPLRFEAYPCPEGVAINDLVYAGDRANLSISTTRHGTVDLGMVSRPFAVTEKWQSIPRMFPTRITRSYSLIVDGTVNVKTLPVLVNSATFGELHDAGFLKNSAQSCALTATTFAVDIDLTTIPVLNRKMVGSVIAGDLFLGALELYRSKCEAAVLRNYMSTAFPKTTSPKMSAIYGEETAEWLSSIGVKDYGWDPGKKKAPKVDFYMAQLAEVSLKGLSSVPSVSETRERVTAFDLAEDAVKRGVTGAKAPKSLPAGMVIMAPFLRELDAAVAAASKADSAVCDEAIKTWVGARLASAEKAVDDLTLSGAKARFSLVLGRKWPSDLGDPANKSLPVKIVDDMRGVTVSTVGTLELIEKKIDI